MATYYVDLNGNISTSPQNKKKKSQYYVDIDGNISMLEQEVDEELEQKTEKNKFWKNWFEKGAFSDGYQFWDVSKTILGTVNDVTENVNTAVFDATENLIDTTAYGVGLVGGYFSDDFQDDTKDFIAKDLLKSKETGEWLANASNWLHPVGWATKLAGINDGEDTDEVSLLGEKSEGLVQSAAHMAGSRALNIVGVPWQLTTGVNSFGSELERAFSEGASYNEAGISGLVNAGIEIGTESLFAGSGLGEKGLIDTSAATKGIKNQIVKTLASYGVDIAAEGTEEVVAEIGNKIVSSIYTDEAPELASWDAFHDYVDAFIGGAVMGGGMNIGKVNTSLKTGADYNTGLTQDEQAVVDKETEKRIAQREEEGEKVTNKDRKAVQEQVVRDMRKGYITIDTIEEALGGDTYTAYQDSINKKDALQKEYDELYNMKGIEKSDAQIDRQAELKRQLDEMKTNAQGDQLKTKLSEEVKNLVTAPGKNGRNSLLVESYNEQARRSQKFDADMTKYNGKQQETIQRAIDSGILNNTNRTHEFVDLIAKISADKGVSFDFTNNVKLKESGFAVDGKQVNGYVTADGVTLNIQSNKALNSVVGHEITHVLEGTNLYTELQSAIKQYAESKGEYQARVAAVTKLYSGMDADIDLEVTADLVGDYLFTDPDFVHKLSTEHRNVFQKVYDEIKYLAKVATAGSKEARQLEKAKKVFEDAYRSNKSAETKEHFEVSSTVEETADLLAMHNIKSTQLAEAIDRGGLMMPSLAVTNKGFVDFGEISLVFDKNTIDPTVDDQNKLYGADAWTPQQNAIKKNAEFDAAKTASVVENLKNNIGEYSNQLFNVSPEQFSKTIADANGNIIEAYAQNIGMQTAYAMENGIVENIPLNENGTVDTTALMSELDAELDTDEGWRKYRKWLNNISDTIITKYDAATNEDLLNNMKAQPATAKKFKLSVNGELVVPAAEYSSIEEVRQNKGRLSEDAANATQKAAGDFLSWADAIAAKTQTNAENVVKSINEAFDNRYDTSEIVNTFAEKGITLSQKDAAALQSLYKDAVNLPAAYFEAKPGRMVSLDEIKAAVVPKDTSAELKQALLDNGVSVVEYDPNVEGDRQRALNQFEEYKFSLSEGEFTHIDNNGEIVYNGSVEKGERSDNDGYSRQELGSDENLGNGVAGLQGRLGESDSARGFSGQSSRLSQIFRLNPKTEEALAKSGVVSFELVDSTNDSGAFSNALNEARNADTANGWAVTPKSAEELVEEGVRTVMSADGKAGLGVTTDGDIVAVFKNPNGGPKKALDTLIPAALENGGKKLDCYGPGLVDLYSRYGFIPVSRVTFNPEYANDGWTPDKGQPDIYFMVHNGDSADTVIANKGKYKVYTDAELEALPLYGKEAYDDAMAYRDAIIQQGIAPTKNSLSAESDIAPTRGTNNVYGKDIALEQEDVAPVQDSVQPAVQDSVVPDDYAPTSEWEANALSDENLASITDEDAPPAMETEYDDFTDTVALDPKALKGVSKALKDVLYLNNKEVKAIGDVVQKYSTTEFPDKADLFYELQDKFGKKESVERNEETAAVKKVLRGYPINVSQSIKNDIADYGAFMRRNFGKVRFSKDGVPVDTAYQDLSSMFPEYFPADITNASDQLMRITEVAGMEINETETFELSDGDIMEAVNVITAEVGKYKESQVQTAAEADRQAAFGQIEDIAPVVERETVEIPAPADTSKPIKTVKERLSAKLQNYQTELATNKQQRIDSQASYEEEISRLYEEYSGKKSKNTKAANDILRRIDRLQTMKGNVDADYAKRISDLEAKVEKINEEVRTGESTTEQAAMRQEVHADIVDNIKTTFGERGYDFDKVLENAKDLSTFSTVDNTPQRVMEKALGYKEGQILSDLTVNKVAQNETEGIKWLNSFTDRKNGLLAKISKRYNIKPGSKESAAAQMYAEGFYVNKDNDIIQYGDAELATDFPDVTVQERIKGLAHDPLIRQIYDETLSAINESRARNAYPEIQRLDNYFLHFRAQTDTFSRLGIPFNPKDIKAKDLPTDLNGVTADLKPGQPYFASAMHRKGKRTSFDLLGGLEQYLTGAKDQIYHIDDIQTLRALRNYIADNYGQAKGLDNLAALTEEEADAKIKEVFSGHLSTFAKFLNEEANVIAGKTSLTDRGLEGVIGRRGITFIADINKQVGANMVGFNVSSSMTNLISAVQGFAKSNKIDFAKAMAQYTANKFKSISGKSDGFAEQSPVMIRRKGADRFHRTAWQKVGDSGYVLMEVVDNVSTELLARAKYNEMTRKGMDAQQAHQEADKWASRILGDRSLGQQPQLYNSKMLGILTKFQLEVRNQLDSQFYDTIKEAEVETEYIENNLKRNAMKAAKVTSTFFQLAVAQHLFGKAFESVAGYNPAFDIIDVLSKLFGFDDEEDDEDTALDNVQEAFMALLEDLPYTSTFTGGRIPISSAVPIKQLVTGKDDYGNEKARLDTLAEAAPYYFLPGGYSQIRKTTQGLSMFSGKDKPSYYEVDEDGTISQNFVTGSYTDSGNLRFPVDASLGNVAQAAIFGQWANKNAREYFDEERKPMEKNQIVEYDMLDLPISEYWEYREGLAKQKTMEEKLDYIDSLDLPIDKKNIMANNVANRESYVDMTDYDDFGSLEEFDFASKNPEKYDFFEQSGITYEAYANGDEDAKRAYNWAYENPGKYTLSKAVASDVVEYRQYAKMLSEINGKDANGETVNGLAKERKYAYISSLDIDAGAKAILFKLEYPGSYVEDNDFILQYIDSLTTLSVDEKLTIAKELGFTVYPDGTVGW